MGKNLIFPDPYKEPGAGDADRHPGHLRKVRPKKGFQFPAVHLSLQNTAADFLFFQRNPQIVIRVPVIPLKLNIPDKERHRIEQKKKGSKAGGPVPAFFVSVNKKRQAEPSRDPKMNAGFFDQRLYPAHIL